MKWNIKLKLKRIALQLSRKEISEKIGVNIATYSRWERGEHMPLPIYRNVIEKLFADETIFKGDDLIG